MHASSRGSSAAGKAAIAAQVKTKPVSIKKIVKKRLGQARHWWYSTFHAFTPGTLADELRALGLREGDVVLTHVAYNEFLGFTGGPSDVVKSLRDAIGESGTLLMPSMAFTGTALSYVRSGQMFDVRRTPSHMGLVTELFRRSPGTLRSLHPTHPILASGPKAEELLRGHPLARTPCGEHSPFAELSQHRAKILLLGTGIGALTFYHYLEELLEDMLPQSPFTSETFDVAFRGRDGETLQVSTRLFDPEVSRRRDLGALERELRAVGAWRQRKIGRVVAVLVEPDAVRDAVRSMAERGTYCYG